MVEASVFVSSKPHGGVVVRMVGGARMERTEGLYRRFYPQSFVSLKGPQGRQGRAFANVLKIDKFG
jgi:hypothetical protein